MTLSWIRLTLPLSVALLPACTPPPTELTSTSELGASSSSAEGPGPSTTPGTTLPGEDTVGTQGATGTDTTMGAVDTTAGTSVGDDDTTMGVEPTAGSSDSTTGKPPPPECEVDDECLSNQVCDAGMCVEACGGSWGTGSYANCLNQYGSVDIDGLCGAGHVCASGGDPIEAATCASQGCNDACDCAAPPPTGNAVVTCGNLTVKDMDPDCFLSCANGEMCPVGMVCRVGLQQTYCTHPVQPLAMYGNCDEIAATCAGGTCGLAGSASVCTEGCSNAGDCEPAPAGAMAPECDDVFNPPGGSECFLPCNFVVGDCPAGMDCFDVPGPGGACMW